MIAPSTDTRTAAVALMLAYAGIVLSPLLIVAFVRPVTDHGFVYTAGKNLALVGFAMFAVPGALLAAYFRTPPSPTVGSHPIAKSSPPAHYDERSDLCRSP